MTEFKETKAWKHYQKGKSLVRSRPEASWLGNEEGMRQDQAIRIRTAICKAYGIDIDLRKSLKLQFIQKYTHENNLIPYIHENYDALVKLAIHGVDDKPRTSDEVLKADMDISDDDDLRGGTIE